MNDLFISLIINLKLLIVFIFKYILILSSLCNLLLVMIVLIIDLLYNIHIILLYSYIWINKELKTCMLKGKI